MNSLKKLIQSPLSLRFLSPVLFGILFYLFRSTAVSLGYATPFPVEILTPFMFMSVTVLCIFSYIVLMLYPAFWLTDRLLNTSNIFLLIPCLIVPPLFNLIVHLAILNESLLRISWTKSWTAYLLSAVVSGWGVMTWIRSRTPDSSSGKVLDPSKGS
jgi:hypothetical protein